MDESHQGATNLLDRARREQTEAYRVAEAKLIEAVDLYDHGRHDEARPLFEQVLLAIPDHQQAREYMAQIEIHRASAQPAEAPQEAPSEPGAEPLEEPLDLPDLGAAEAGGDLAGISPGEVVLDEGGADVGLAGSAAAAPLADPETEAEAAAGAAAETGLDELDEFAQLDGEVEEEAAPRRSRRPLMIVAFLLIVGGGVAGWFYRDEIKGLFEEKGDESVLSQEQRAALPPPEGGEAKSEAEILEMIEEAANGSAKTGPETVGPESGPAQAAAPTFADVGRLLEDARADVRAGRGREALATLKLVLELDEGNREVAGVQKPARLIVTAREGFQSGEYEDSLRALYRLDSRVEASLRPVAVSRWLDNTRWNFLLGQLEEEQPWRVLDLTHPSRGELQLRGADRDAVRPLIEMARRWQYESARDLRRGGYHDELKAFSYRSFDQ
jgi:hypothetical protein